MDYKFPIINHIDDLMSKVSHLHYINASLKENGTTGVCYIYTEKDSFANEWERECRGITFHADGSVASRTLHKFFNLNERVEYSVKNLDFNKVRAIYPKLDGSMISPCVLNEIVCLKSKNSFTSDVAVKSQEWIELKENAEYIRFCLDLDKMGLTPTFEFTSPSNRIVVKYDYESLTLLQVRNNVTGEYLDIDEVSKGYDIKVIKPVYSKDKDIEELVREMEHMKDIEGFIVMFENGDMVKLKCAWYIGLHHSVTFLRERDIANLVCTQSLDDLRGFIDLGKYDGVNMERVDEIEKEILDYIKDFKLTIETKVSEIRSKYKDELDFKEITLQLRKELGKEDGYIFAFIMNELRGHEPIDYFDHYKRKVLKVRWSSEQID